MMPLRTRHLNRFANAEGGQAVIEFALFSSLFILILAGAADLTFYMIGAMAVQEAATEGAAYGASPGNQNDNSGMVTWASQAAVGVALSATPVSQTFFACSPGGAAVTSTTICTGGAAPMEYVKVTATANVNPLFKVGFLSSGAISRTAIYRVAWKTQ